MTISEAQQICGEYYGQTNPTEEDTFLMTEALGFLIRETGDSEYMVELGGIYYGLRQFDLALKYYEMAAAANNLSAIVGLGYIWYYGRIGERNYEKAFYYYNKAYKMGDIVAAYKVADMYRNGWYVEQDLGKYRQMIEELYPLAEKARYLGDPIPEIFTRLAGIRTEEGNTAEALRLYDVARDFLAQRIRYNPFFGNLTIMKGIIRDIYKLRPFDEEMFTFYDLYYVLERPAHVRFIYNDAEHEIEALIENGMLVIRFDSSWFRTADDFFAKAELNGQLLTTLYEDLYDFEIAAEPE